MSKDSPEHQMPQNVDRYTQVVIDVFSKWSNHVSVQEGIVFLLIQGKHQPITLVAMGDEQSNAMCILI